MKVTIRKGMFETNSSAMHSIILCKDNSSLPKDYKEKNIKYILSIENESYTRGEGRLLISPFEKTKFMMALFTYIHDTTSEEDNGRPIYNENFDKEWKEFSSLIESFYKKRHSNVILQKPKITVSKGSYKNSEGDIISYNIINTPYDSEGFFDFSGYEDELFEPSNLENIIFNEKSYIIVGGDEYESCYNLYAFMIKNTDYSKYIRYPHGNKDYPDEKRFDKISLNYDEASKIIYEN